MARKKCFDWYIFLIQHLLAGIAKSSFLVLSEILSYRNHKSERILLLNIVVLSATIFLWFSLFTLFFSQFAQVVTKRRGTCVFGEYHFIFLFLLNTPSYTSSNTHHPLNYNMSFLCLSNRVNVKSVFNLSVPVATVIPQTWWFRNTTGQIY